MKKLFILLISVNSIVNTIIYYTTLGSDNLPFLSQVDTQEKETKLKTKIKVFLNKSRICWTLNTF